MKKIRTVYIASPLFNPKEREENIEIAKVLKKAKYDVFLPQKIMLWDLEKEFSKIIINNPELSNQIAEKAIACIDIYELSTRDALVLNLNGRVPDEGAVGEAGIAFALKKPIVLYKEDSRAQSDGRDSMIILAYSNFGVVNDIKSIPKELKRLESLAESKFETTIGFGRIINTYSENYSPEAVKLAVLDKIGIDNFLNY